MVALCCGVPFAHHGFEDALGTSFSLDFASVTHPVLTRSKKFLVSVCVESTDERRMYDLSLFSLLIGRITSFADVLLVGLDEDLV